MDIEAISAMKSAQAMLQAQVRIVHGKGEQAKAVMSILLQGMAEGSVRAPEQNGRNLDVQA